MATKQQRIEFMDDPRNLSRKHGMWLVPVNDAPNVIGLVEIGDVDHLVAAVAATKMKNPNDDPLWYGYLVITP